MKHQLKIILWLSIFCLVACKKETPHYTVSDEMKQYFAYKIGSYWIYINDSTKIIDSSYLTDVVNSTQGVGKDGRHLFSYDFIGLSFHSKFLIEYEVKNDCDQKMTKLYIGLGENQTISFHPVAYVEGAPSNQNYYTNCGRPFGALWMETIPLLTLNEVTYSNVAQTILRYSEQLSNQIQNKVLKFYFAKNIGLLKYQYILNDSLMESWSLKRQKVHQ